MWFFYALFSIMAWAGSDLFTKMGTNPKDKLSHLRIVIMVGIVMGIHAIVYIITTGVEYNPVLIIKYFPVSAMYILSMVLGYVGLRYIELSVSSPICNASGAVTALLCFIFLGQRMDGMQLLAVTIISGGIMMLAAMQKRVGKQLLLVKPEDRKYEYSIIAILFPILYCVIDGMGSFFDAFYLENFMTEAEANLSYEFTFLIAAAVSWCYIVFVKKEKFSFFKEKVFSVAAICETAGQFTYVYAIADNAIVAAPMIASYSIFSVLLSRIFLKEKLDAKRYALIFLVMLGIAILGFYDA